ncbi:MAG: glycosyltransferase involved in cell wall biosynthesis, partial [Cyclobacteriaceae bacterium]
RPELLTHGIDLRCVTVGKRETNLVEADYIDEGCILLAKDSNNIKKQSIAFVEWCEQEKIDIVMAINSIAILSALPHLPEHIRVISRCANGFDHGYKITLSCRERLSAIVALTPKLQDDLITRYGADPSIIHLIPNGLDPNPFEKAAKSVRGEQTEIQLGFLGRLEHNQKGALHIPEIVQELNRLSVPFHLKIAGKGKHENALKKKLAHEIKNAQVEFMGALGPKDVPNYLATIDVFLFTSHFEGCPNALLEAMMAGCVPVSNLIEGTTDFIIEDGSTGYLCNVNNARSFSEKIAKLSANKVLLSEMSARVTNAARKRFTRATAAQAYTELIFDLLNIKALHWSVRPWSEFKADPNFEHSYFEFVPKSLRVKIRTLIDQCIN